MSEKLTGSNLSKSRLGAVLAVVICLLLSASSFAQQAPATTTQMKAEMARLPLAFEPNRGQADKDVKFLSRGPGYLLLLTRDEAVLSLGTSKANSKRDMVRLQLAGANRAAQATGLDALGGKTNYFLGNDPKQWRTNIPNYSKVRYAQVYPGVDLLYYGKQNSLEHDFIVAPNADPGKIAFNIKGAKQLRVDEKGNLLLTTANGQIQLDKPFIYQTDRQGKQVEVAGGFALQGKRVSFHVGPYDKSRELVIDPVLNYASYFGGDSTTTVSAITVDASGNAYITGSTASSVGTLAGTALGTPDRDGSTKLDVFVAKLNASGSAVMFTTIIGGPGNDVGNAIAVDGSGNVHIAGQTSSGTFPTSGGAYRTVVGNVLPDGFALKLPSDGSALTYSTYLNGGAVATDGADNAKGIAVTAGGHIIVTGSTASTTFYPAGHVFGTDLTQNGNIDGFLLRLNPAGTGNADLAYGTYWGGSDEDVANGMVIQSGNRAVIAGYTKSANYPFGGGEPDGALSGTQDGFVAAISTGGAFVTSITCVDSTADRRVDIVTTTPHGLSVGDSFTITGTTDSADIDFSDVNETATVTGTSTLSYQETTCNNRNGQAAGITPGTSRLIGRRNTSTFAGGNLVDAINGIAIDGTGAIYVVGTTDSDAQSNTVISQANAISTGGLNTTDSGAATDAFVVKLTADLQNFTYSFYLGGTGNDTGTGISVNPTCAASCEVLVTGTTASAARFTSNSLQGALNGAQDGFIARVASAGTSLIYSTYFGGSGADGIAGVAGVYAGTAGAPTAAVIAANVAGTIGTPATFGSGTTVTSSAANTATVAAATVVVARLAANNGAAPTLTLAAVDSIDPIANSVAQTTNVVYTWTVTNTDPNNTATNVTLDVPTPQTAGATATANLTADAVTSVTVDNGGFGYNTPPTATFVGGDGAGAVAGAVTLTNGVVTAVAVDNGGATYTVPPNVTFTGGTPGADLISIASTNNAGCTFKAGTTSQPGGMTCQLGTVAAANGTASVQVTASPTTVAGCVNTPCPLGTITLNGRANAAEPSTVATGSVTTSIVPVTNLVVTGTAESFPGANSTYRLGVDTSLTYEITVTNTSGATIAANDAGLDVLIESVYSSDPQFVVTSVKLNTVTMVLGPLVQGVDGCFNDVGNNKVQCNVASILAGGTAVVEIVGSFNPGTLNPAVPLFNTTSKFGAAVNSEIFTADAGNTNVNVTVNYTGPEADLQITAFAEAADPVRTAQDVVYTVTADNAGPTDATSVTVTLTPAVPSPANGGTFTFAENSIGDGTVPVVCTQSGGAGTVINCVIDNADMTAAAAAITFTVTGTLTLDANVPTSNQTMTAEINTAGATSDPTSANDSLNATTTIRREAALSVSNFSAPTTVADGATFTYTFDVANAGLDNATSSIVTLSLPQNTNAATFTGNSFTNQACTGTTTVTCDIGTINAGASGIGITVTVTPAVLGAGVASAAFNGAITNIASANVVSTGGTKTAANILTTIQRQTTISVANLVDTVDPVASSATISYTVDVSNTGANIATNVKLDFTVPTGTTTATPGCAVQAPTVIRCNVASVATGGGAQSVGLTVTPAASFIPANQSSATFSASVAFNAAASTENIDSGGGSLTDGAEDTLVERRADIQLVTLTATPTAHEDGNITVAAQVTNLSGATATNVQVQFTFNHNYRFVSANIVTPNGLTLPAFSCTTSTATTRTCSLPDLPLTNPYTFNVIVQPESGIVATNNPAGNSTNVNVSATVTASVVQTNTANDTLGPIVTEVQRQANLRASGALTLFNGSTTINSSANATYNLTVRNDGPNTVNGATVVFSFTNNVVAALDTSAGAQTAWGGLGTCVRDNASQVTCTMAAGFATGARSGAITITPDSTTLLASTNSAPYDITAFISSAQAYDNGTTGAAGVDNSTAIIQTTVQRQADLRVVSKIAPAAVADGGNISYTITVQNFGPDAAGSVRLVDPLAGTGNVGTLTGSPTGGFTLNAVGATFVSPTIGAGVCTPNSVTPTTPSVTVVCMMGPMNAGQQATITISGVANIDANVASATFNNVATVDAAQNAGDPIGGGTQTAFETNSGNNSNNVVSTTVSRSADLIMTLAESTPVLVGGALDPGGAGTNFTVGTHEAIRYDITVQNSAGSSTDVTNAAVQVTLPSTLTFSAVASPACSAVGQVVTCPVAGTLVRGGAPAAIFFVATPGATLPISGSNVVITITPSVSAAGNTDPDGSNNALNNTTTVQRVSDLGIEQTQPALPISVQDSPATPTFTYTWTVTNNGPSNATGVVVTNPLPADLQFVSGSWPLVTGTPAGNCTGSTTFGATITCNLSTVQVGATVTITVTVRPTLNTGLANKQVGNQPSITGSVQDNVGANNNDADSIQLRGVTDLQVTITPVQDPAASAGQVLVGNNQTWTVTVTNNGPYPAGGLITLTNTIDPNVGLASVVSTGFGCGGTLTCPLGTLGVGASQTVNVTTTTPALAVTGQTTIIPMSAVVTQYTNGTNIAGDITDPNTANNTGNASVTGRAAANLGVSQVSPGSVVVGQSGTKFTVTVANGAGRSDATNVVLTNVIAVDAPTSVSTTASGLINGVTPCNAATGLGTATITIVCNVGDIAAGAQATVDLALTPTLGGSLGNTPSVTGTEVDPAPANNTALQNSIIVNTQPPGQQTFSPTDAGTGQPVPGAIISGFILIPGNTTMTASPNNLTNVVLPVNYRFGTGGSAGVGYTISNTATFQGNVTVCVQTPETFFQPHRARIFLLSVNPAVDRTIAGGFLQVVSGGAMAPATDRQVCGTVPGLPITGSTFVVMEPVSNLPNLDAVTVSVLGGGGKGTAGTTILLDGLLATDPDVFPCMNYAALTAGISTAVPANCNDGADLRTFRWVGAFLDVQAIDPATGLRVIVKNCRQDTAITPFFDGLPCNQAQTSVGLGTQTITLTVIDENASLHPGDASLLAVKLFTVGSTGAAGDALSQTASQGQTGTFSFSYTFSANTTFAFTGTPALAANLITCSAQPLTFTGPGVTQTSTVTVLCSTTSPSFGLKAPVNGGDSGNMVAGIVGLTSLPVLGLVLLPGRTRRGRKLRMLATFLLITLMVVFMASCGGGTTGGGFGGAPQQLSAGTPKGVYTIQVNATPAPTAGGNPVKTLTLTVQ